MLCCQKSKHVVQLVESFSFDSNLYLVTKYASGGDLLQYCLAQDNSKQWMDEKRAKHIFAQLAQGLFDMHQVGLVHRDLKLLNIFLCDSTAYPRVQIGDLGLACKLRENQFIVKKAGTFAFMAPEVMLNQPANFKSDIWSLGIILFILIASRSPFDGHFFTKNRQAELLALEISFDHPVWQTVSPQCVSLLRGMLEKNQSNRFDIKQVLHHPWLAMSQPLQF